MEKRMNKEELKNLIKSLDKYFEYLKTSTREKEKVKYEIVKKQLESKKNCL